MKSKNELLNLMNVGPATLQDLQLLGIETIADLAKQNDRALYDRLEKITGAKQDPCVLDVFTAIILEARTGQKTPWWHWSRVRKEKIS